mmetsp:Transcript_18730/g.54907  ORF Transcript_18730/g.54907 Transcript_18730/m.54907 type:complete len:307 (+) Transcript_18730:456-1376(+)
MRRPRATTLGRTRPYQRTAPTPLTPPTTAVTSLTCMCLPSRCARMGYGRVSMRVWRAFRPCLSCTQTSSTWASTPCPSSSLAASSCSSTASKSSSCAAPGSGGLRDSARGSSAARARTTSARPASFSATSATSSAWACSSSWAARRVAANASARGTRCRTSSSPSCSSPYLAAWRMACCPTPRTPSYPGKGTSWDSSRAASSPPPSPCTCGIRPPSSARRSRRRSRGMGQQGSPAREAQQGSARRALAVSSQKRASGQRCQITPSRRRKPILHYPQRKQEPRPWIQPLSRTTTTYSVYDPGTDPSP